MFISRPRCLTPRLRRHWPGDQDRLQLDTCAVQLSAGTADPDADESGRRCVKQLASPSRATYCPCFPCQHVKHKKLTKEALQQWLAAGRPVLVRPE
jgi:hypothetical protein